MASTISTFRVSGNRKQIVCEVCPDSFTVPAKESSRARRAHVDSAQHKSALKRTRVARRGE